MFFSKVIQLCYLSFLLKTFVLFSLCSVSVPSCVDMTVGEDSSSSVTSFFDCCFLHPRIIADVGLKRESVKNNKKKTFLMTKLRPL